LASAGTIGSTAATEDARHVATTAQVQNRNLVIM
jgi:hypothetical protein